jgi:hypothetical protein
LLLVPSIVTPGHRKTCAQKQLPLQLATPDLAQTKTG